MYKYTIVEPLNGYEVYVNLISSLAGAYIRQNPHVINLLKEVIEPTPLAGERLVIEQDMGRVIGNTEIVETGEKDTIYYAQRYKTKVFARFAKNRSPLPSTILSVLIIRDTDGNYEVLDTWIGPYSPPFPGDKLETVDSRSYWETHALAQDARTVQTKTITKLCPY